ncbi:MAG TPA: xanthine dehydrogenase family protein subunit M, partial [Actinomycetota bacterium]
YTNVGPTPLRSEQAERALLGGPVSQAAARTAGLAAAEELDLDDDLRGSAAYKRRVVVAVTERALRLAAARTGGAEAA